jgi:hypothetical protein
MLSCGCPKFAGLPGKAPAHPIQALPGTPQRLSSIKSAKFEELPAQHFLGDLIHQPSRTAGIRAHAAFAVVKGATLAALDTAEGQLTALDRSEIRAAALRALSGEGRPARP